VNGICIVTGCAKFVPLGSHRKTDERATNPGGAARGQLKADVSGGGNEPGDDNGGGNDG